MPNHKYNNSYKGGQRSQQSHSEWPSLVSHDSASKLADKTVEDLSMTIKTRDENLSYLLEIFPEVDKDVVNDILEQCGDDVPKATDQLFEILEEGKRQIKQEETDLAIIACSLLSDEAMSSKKLNAFSSPTERLQGELDQIENRGINSPFSVTSPQPLMRETQICSTSPFQGGLKDIGSSTVSNDWGNGNDLNFEKCSKVQSTSGTLMTGQSHKAISLNKPVKRSLTVNGDRKQKFSFENHSPELAEHYRGSKLVSANNYSIGGVKNISVKDCYLSNSSSKTQLESFISTSDRMNQGNLQEYLFPTSHNINESFSEMKKSQENVTCVNVLRNFNRKSPSKKTSDQINGWAQFYEQLDLDPDEIDFIPGNFEDLMRQTMESSFISLNSSTGLPVTPKTTQKKRNRRSKKKHNAQRMEVNNLSKEYTDPDIENREEIEENLLYPKETLNIPEARRLSPNIGQSEMAEKVRNVAEGRSGRTNSMNISYIENTETKINLSPNAAEFLPRPLKSYQQAMKLGQQEITQIKMKGPSGNLDSQPQAPEAGSPKKKKSGKSKKRECALSSSLNQQQLAEANGHREHVQNNSHENIECYDDPVDPLGWHAILSPKTLGEPKTQKTSKEKKNTSSPMHQSQQRQKPPWAVGLESSDLTRSGEDHLKKFESVSKKTRSQSTISIFSSSSGESKQDLKKIHTPQKPKTFHQLSNETQPHSGPIYGEPVSIQWVSPQKMQSSSLAPLLPPSLLGKIDLSSSLSPKNPTAENLMKRGPALHSGASTKDLKTPEACLDSLKSSSNETVLFKNKLAFRGVKTPVDIIRLYILEKQPVLVILRGLPGSGKSYLAKQIMAEGQKMGTEGVILSTDDYFIQQGIYRFNRNDLGTAHDWNKQRALTYVRQSKSPIIIDNTNTTLWEFLPYAEVALKHKYDVQVFEPDTAWSFKVRELARRNCHGVTKDAIARMKERYEKITTDDLLKAASFSRRNIQVPSVAETAELPECKVNQLQDLPPPLIPSLMQTNYSPALNPSLISHQWNPVQQQYQSPIQPPLLPQQLAPWQQSLPPWQGPSTSPLCHTLFQQQLAPKQQLSPLQHLPLHASPQQQPSSVHQPLLSPKPAPKQVAAELVAHVEPWLCQTLPKQLTEPLDALNGEETSEKQSSSSPTAVADTSGYSEWFEAKEQRILKKKKKTGGSSEPENNSSGITVEYLGQSLKKALINLSNGSKPTSSHVSEEEVVKPIVLENIHLLSEGKASNLSNEISIVKAESTRDEKTASEKDLVSPSDLERFSCQEDSSYTMNEDNGIKDQGCSVDDPCKDLSEFNTLDEAERVSQLNCSCSTVESFKSCCSDKEMIYSKYGDIDSESERHSWEFSTEGSQRKGLNVEAANSYLQNEESQKVDTPATVVDVVEFNYMKIQDSQSNGDGESSQNNKDFMKSVPQKNINASTSSASEKEEEENLSENDATFIPAINSTLSSLSILDQYFNSSPSLDGVDQEDKAEIDYQRNEEGNTLINEVFPLSIVDYSASDNDNDGKGPGREEKIFEGGHPSLLDTDVGLHMQNVLPLQEVGDICLTESSVPTSKEGSPKIEGNENSDSSPSRRVRKKRVKKGRNHGPFIDDSLKVKSKTESWSSFYKQHTDDMRMSPLEVTNSETPSPSTEFKSKSSQCDSYYFSLLHKLNSSAFNKLQPIDLSLSDVRVVSSLWSECGKSASANTQASFVARKSETNDMSTNTDEAMEKEEVDLETLQNCFPEYSRKQLEYTMAVCHNNLEWVCSHLLDSPALIDIVEEKADKTPVDLNEDSQANKLKSLAELCSSVAKRTNQVDQDDLEMQIIEAGETRLQKIETFGWSRIHSYERGRLNDSEFDYFSLEDFRGSVSSEASWEVLQKHMVPQYKTKPPNNVSGSSNNASKDGLLSKSPGGGQISYSHAPLATKSPEWFATPAMTPFGYKQDSGVTTSATLVKAPTMPKEFIKCLELLYGPLNLSVGDEGLPLDDIIARKIYNCLKLQATKKVIYNISDEQLQNDEALARALQEEENSQQQNKTNTLPLGSGKKSVAGWTNQMPAWMYQGGGIPGLQGHSGSTTSPLVTGGSNSKKLKGSQGKKLKPFNLPKRLSGGGIKSVWAGVKRRGQADSLQSIMEEEQAREESQKEQMRLFELTGDTQALATRIKRNKLAELFPSLSPEFLEDVFMNAGYSMEDTVKILGEVYNISPAPMSKERQEEIMEEAKERSREEYYSQYLFPEDVYERFEGNASPMTYEELRNEALFYRGLARECQEKASRYQADGMPGAALFYRQKVKDYKSYESDSNQRAAEVLFEKGKERLTKENTLDLHFYHLDEAVSAVNFAIAMKEEEFRQRPDRKNTYLNIVTGRGRNSKDGVPILKPAIMNHLREKCLRFEEKSPGMLKVFFNQRL